MTNIRDFYDPTLNPTLNELVKVHPMVDPAIVVEAVKRAGTGGVLEHVELELRNTVYRHTGDDPRTLYDHFTVAGEYSNGDAQYGERVNTDGSVQRVIQLTLKNPADLTRLANEPFVAHIRVAQPLAHPIHITEVSGKGSDSLDDRAAEQFRHLLFQRGATKPNVRLRL